MKSVKSALISIFIVGGGQIYAGRLWTGIAFAVIFYGSILLMRNIWTGLNPAFWSIVGVWFLFWLYNIFDAYKGARLEQPPCERVCPAGIAPWVYINLIATESKEKYPFFPFFNILERICPAPCEDQCTRKIIDSAVAIKYLKSAVKTSEPAVSDKKRNKKVGIIGAGPCGLSAGYYLVNKGYSVTIYEKEEKPGGVLRTFIPEFRLSTQALENEIKKILDCGIELKCRTEVGKDISMDELLQKYDALFIATGAWEPVKMNIPGEEMCLNGLEVLKRIKQGEEFRIGQVGVIGGGNTAIDVARSLIRQGNKVTIYYRRRIEDMPAEHEDREEALEEGIKIIPLCLPRAVKKDRVVMVKTESPEGRLGEVKVIEDSEFEVKLDKLIMACGQKPKPDFLKPYVNIDEAGRIKTKDGRTSNPRIFAGGDAVLGSKTLAHAVGQAKETAESIDLSLRGIHPFIGRLLKKTYLPRVELLPIKDIPRIKIPHRNIEERKHDFLEVELRAKKEDLKKEADRCLVCPLRYRP